MNWHGHIHMDEPWTRTWTCDNQSNEAIEAIHYSRNKGDENGGHKPGDGGPASAPGNHSDQRKTYEPCYVTDKRRKHIIHVTDPIKKGYHPERELQVL